MRSYPNWLPASLLLLALGCSQAGAPTPVNVAGAPVVASPAPAASPSSAEVAPATPVPSRPESPSPMPTPSTAPRAWLAFGDSITQDAFATPLAWGEVMGADGPTAINAGVRGDTAAGAIARIDGLLAAHPEARYVGIAFGTNDAWGRVPVATFKAQVQAVIDRIQAAGKVPVLATVAYSPETELAKLPEYNQALLDLQATNGLPAGPDLYGLVYANEGYLSGDGVHMTPLGSQAIQRAWAEVAARQAW